MSYRQRLRNTDPHRPHAAGGDCVVEISLMMPNVHHPAVTVQTLGELRLWSARFIPNLVYNLTHHHIFNRIPPKHIQSAAESILDHLCANIAEHRDRPHAMKIFRVKRSLNFNRRQWMELTMMMIDATDHFLSPAAQAEVLPILHRLMIALGRLHPRQTRIRRPGRTIFVPPSSSSTQSRPTPADPG